MGQPARLQKFWCTRIIQLIIKITTFRCCGINKSFLCRSAGAHLVEKSLTLIVMFLVYRRQLMVALLALDTKVLPAARDICATWYWHESHVSWWRLVQRMLIINLNEQVDLIVAEKFNGTCNMTRFRRMTRADQAAVQARHLTVTVSISLAIILVMVVPTMLHAVNGYFFREASDADEVTNSEQVSEIDELRAVSRRQQENIERLSMQVLNLRNYIDQRLSRGPGARSCSRSGDSSEDSGEP